VIIMLPPNSRCKVAGGFPREVCTPSLPLNMPLKAPLCKVILSLFDSSHRY
jgi:hypothetical protein